MGRGLYGGAGQETSYLAQHAVNEIKNSYNEEVFVKPKSLLKFGRNADVDTAARETIWVQGGNETYISSNLIDTVSSADASDTVDVRIEGHTIDASGNLTFVVQDATLNGQNKVTLATPLARGSRVFNIDATDLAGDVYVYEDTDITAGVPDDAAKTHIRAIASENQSLKAATSFSQYDYGIITKIFAGLNRSSSVRGEVYFQVRENGGVFRTKFTLPIDSDGGSTFIYDFKPFYIVPKNADVRMTVEVTANNAIVSGGFNALLGLLASQA